MRPIDVRCPVCHAPPVVGCSPSLHLERATAALRAEAEARRAVPSPAGPRRHQVLARAGLFVLALVVAAGIGVAIVVRG